jgi:hypothetical protein
MLERIGISLALCLLSVLSDQASICREIGLWNIVVFTLIDRNLLMHEPLVSGLVDGRFR